MGGGVSSGTSSSVTAAPKMQSPVKAAATRAPRAAAAAGGATAAPAGGAAKQVQQMQLALEQKDTEVRRSWGEAVLVMPLEDDCVVLGAANSGLACGLPCDSLVEAKHVGIWF